jgi:LysR family transcriptional regulator, glycine cleavage system transcriptional activator
MSFSHETIERFNTARTRMIRLKAVRALPLTALRTFEAAARHGSFTRAAEELHVTQGAVSRQVQALEDRIGVTLFERNGRRLALSSEGRLLANAATDALERLGEAVANLTSPGGTITLSMLPSLAACWMAPRMRAFAAAHPDIDLRLSASRHLVDFQREGIDAAIRYGPGGWVDVDAELLGEEQIFPVCSPAYAERLALQYPRDLMRANLLHNDVPDGWRDWFAAAGCTEAFTERGTYLDEDTALLRAAAGGEGIALGRSVLACDDIAQGRLVAPFEVRIAATFSYWFVTPTKARLNRNVEIIRSWLMDGFAQYRSSAQASQENGSE